MMMDKTERARLHFLVTWQIANALFAPPEAPIPLALSSEYVLRMEHYIKIRKNLFDEIIRHLAGQSEKELLRNFDDQGSPQTDAAKTWVSKMKRQVMDALGGLPIWYTAPLFSTDDVADFDHWVRSDYLSVDEVVWLSVGLEPKQKFIDQIFSGGPTRGSETSDKIIRYMTRHKEVIRRRFDPKNLDIHPNWNELYAWIDEVALHVHPKFLEMIASKQSRSINAASKGVDVSVGDKLIKTAHPRTVNAVARIITAIAIREFGYDPDAKKSPIPKEILAIMDALGLQGTTETISKYLKMGAKDLPSGWNDRDL